MSAAFVKSKSMITKSITSMPVVVKYKKQSLDNRQPKNLGDSFAYLDKLNQSISCKTLNPNANVLQSRLKELAMKLNKDSSVPVTEKIFNVQSVLTELSLISPELFIILSKIASVLRETLIEVRAKFEENENKHKMVVEDFKRLNKRYKSIALEMLELQNKVKKYTNSIYTLKNERKELNEEIQRKSEKIGTLLSKMQSMEIRLNFKQRINHEEVLGHPQGHQCDHNMSMNLGHISSIRLDKTDEIHSTYLNDFCLSPL